MWAAMIFSVVMIGFLILILFTKLYKFQGTRLKTRMIYALTLSLFFTLYFLWQSQGNIEVVVRGILIGIVVFVPFSLFDKKRLDKRIEGTRIVYKKKNMYLNIFSVFAIIILMQLLATNNFIKAVIESTWPMLGVCIGWFLGQAYLLAHVIKLEKKLGGPIFEEKEAQLKS